MATSVERLHMASFRLDGRFNPPTYADARMNLYAYLVTAGSDVVLIDTGIGAGNAYIDQHFEPQRTSVTDALARVDREVTDVGLVVNSHLHFDHCGNNRLFPHAEFYVQEQELATARELGRRYTVPAWFDFAGARIRAVNGDYALLPGIKLLACPGHTPGHQAVLIETGDARILVAAQAAFSADEFVRGGDPKEQAHEGMTHSYVETIARLKSFAADRVCFSHDARSATMRGIQSD